MSKIWRVPVIRSVRGIVEFESNNLADAIYTVKDRYDHGGDFEVKKPGPDELWDCPWEVEWDGTQSEMDWIRQEYNDRECDEAPEMVELVHAYWTPCEHDDDAYVCSNCECLEFDRQGRYCHNCGARMDAERQGTDE